MTFEFSVSYMHLVHQEYLSSSVAINKYLVIVKYNTANACISQDALNWQKRDSFDIGNMTRFTILKKCCSIELFIHPRILKK